MIMQHVNGRHKVKSIKTGTSLWHPLSIIELCQKYSSTLCACIATTQSLLSQVKGHRSVLKQSQQNVHATHEYMSCRSC